MVGGLGELLAAERAGTPGSTTRRSMPAKSRSAHACLGLVAPGPEVLVALGEVDEVALARRRIEQATAELGERLLLLLEAPDDLAVLLDRAWAARPATSPASRLVQTSGGSTTWSSTEIIRRPYGSVPCSRRCVGGGGHAAPPGACGSPRNSTAFGRADRGRASRRRAARARAAGRRRSPAAVAKNGASEPTTTRSAPTSSISARSSAGA